MIDQYHIQLDDLPPDFREIAETIGLEPTLKLVQARSGEGIYVPKVGKGLPCRPGQGHPR